MMALGAKEKRWLDNAMEQAEDGELIKLLNKNDPLDYVVLHPITNR